jgi:hypothetical protein
MPIREWSEDDRPRERLRRLRSQNAILKRGQHQKCPPYVFIEHGALYS